MGIMIINSYRNQFNSIYNNHTFSRMFLSIEAAHKKGSGSTKNGRDSVSKRRGIKTYGKEFINAGGIIVRQVGNTFHPGFNVGSGKDYTLFATTTGIVSYERIKGRKCVSVYPQSDEKKVKNRSNSVNFSRRN